MSEGRLSLAGAYQRLAAHEDLCAERYRGINEKLSWILGGLATMVLALLAWALVQLYALEPLRSPPPSPASPHRTAAGCRRDNETPVKIDGGQGAARIVVVAWRG
ncbi:MAG: hypothetical protein KF842_06290 [Caulobacter sp.]|nr:hypothetical protein [Caulobacter sp.]